MSAQGWSDATVASVAQPWVEIAYASIAPNGAALILRRVTKMRRHLVLMALLAAEPISGNRRDGAAERTAQELGPPVRRSG